VQDNIYIFSGVPHGIDYKDKAEATISKMTDKLKLEEWYGLWMGKLRALDTALSAKKYQTDEGSPYTRMQNLYTNKLKELS